ncbi:hypothetical protein OVA24_12850 [Luteolibacter sp. SL250]|uniref:hypothetical protein n=1 Tax=Luteolibacter sp. SL250 TaxID=2995170 RepID=UPI00226DB8E9|nr:hypothetical protein [Luteolibacter sp. SL250]WAC18125.1 hypothetical protein OVA24_12850 [Luteolibacter sp. SL250]
MKWFCVAQSILLIFLIVVGLGKFSKAEDLWIGEERQRLKNQPNLYGQDKLGREQMVNSLLVEGIFYGRRYAGAAVWFLTLGCGFAAVSSAVIALHYPGRALRETHGISVK